MSAATDFGDAFASVWQLLEGAGERKHGDAWLHRDPDTDASAVVRHITKHGTIDSDTGGSHTRNAAARCIIMLARELRGDAL